MKILIIGQAPPKVTQAVPYDTTMIYEWFGEVGINREEAQDMFDFQAMIGHFPGSDENGHKKPILTDMNEHYEKVLKDKVDASERVILLGNVARDYFGSTGHLSGKYVLELMHPSYRNKARYILNKKKIIQDLSDFLGNDGVSS